MSRIDVLTDELTNDPLTRGYSGMTDAAAATDLNTAYRERNRGELSGTVIFNAITKSEFNALATADQQRVWNILHLGTINPFGLEADLFVDLFGGGSGTIAALQAIRKEPISHGGELGIGVVRAGNVQEARL